MRKFTAMIASLALLITACGHDQQTGLARPPALPELPLVLKTKATALPPLEDSSMGGLVISGSKDDKQYNSVAHQLNTLIDTYDCIKENYNKEKDLKTCLQ